ncbi:MAG: DUF1217 domain-containing protein [Hyphomicrobiales bacterium]|nr:DUF1217 domain-containing protein [Hyphomicrobiales bacterium]
MVSTLVSYANIARDLPRSLENIEAEPKVARDTEYYKANIGKADSVEKFLGDRRLFTYAMKAFGLESMTYAKAFMRKLLTEGVASDTSFANTLSDRRYREFAEAFNFEAYGVAATVFDSAGQGTVDRYVRQTLEERAGQQNEGVRLALYFQRKAPQGLTPFGILGDTALTKVVQTTLGLPASISAIDIDKQAELISKKLDLESLKQPVALDKFIVRFAALWELQNGASTGAANAALLINQPLELGINPNLLTSLQNLRRGGF